MNEDAVQSKRRQNEEEATERRARILGLVYLDTREFENGVSLVRDEIDVDTMHREFVIPLQKGEEGKPYQFMVTSQTPRSTIERLTQTYTDQGRRIQFFLISNSAYQVFMLRHDPPVETHYDDIEIASESFAVKSASDM